MNNYTDIWLFIEIGNTWIRANVPGIGIKRPADLVGYILRGGKITSDWMDIPERARFIPRIIGHSLTVIAKMENGK